MPPVMSSGDYDNMRTDQLEAINSQSHNCGASRYSLFFSLSLSPEFILEPNAATVAGKTNRIVRCVFEDDQN